MVGFWPRHYHIYFHLQVFSLLYFCVSFAFQILIITYAIASEPVLSIALELFDLITSSKTPSPKKAHYASGGGVFGGDAVHYSGVMQELYRPGSQSTELCWPHSDSIVSPIKPTSKIPERHEQRHASWVMLNPVKLTLSIKY